MRIGIMAAARSFGASTVSWHEICYKCISNCSSAFKSYMV